MSAGLPKGWVRLVAGLLVGAILGAALGGIDLLFLARHIDFARPKNFSGPTGEFVGNLLVGVNVCWGVVAGAVAVALLPRRGRLLMRVLPGAVVGGYLGALLGFSDVLLLAPYFNRSDSDLVAVWRENRSLLVILNAAGIAVAGGLAFLLGGNKFPSETGRGD